MTTIIVKQLDTTGTAKIEKEKKTRLEIEVGAQTSALVRQIEEQRVRSLRHIDWQDKIIVRDMSFPAVPLTHVR